MKYLKTIGFEFILLIIFTLIYTILYYFNITSSNVNNILKILSFIIIFLSTGIYIGRNSQKKGWIEGLKISFITIIIFIITSLIFRYNFNLKQILYYILLIILVVIGSMLGINFKKRK